MNDVNNWLNYFAIERNLFLLISDSENAEFPFRFRKKNPEN